MARTTFSIGSFRLGDVGGPDVILALLAVCSGVAAVCVDARRRSTQSSSSWSCASWRQSVDVAPVFSAPVRPPLSLRGRKASAAPVCPTSWERCAGADTTNAPTFTQVCGDGAVRRGKADAVARSAEKMKS